MLLETGDPRHPGRLYPMEDRISLAERKLAVPRLPSASPPWEANSPTSTPPSATNGHMNMKLLPERPEPVYPPMYSRDLLTLKPDTLPRAPANLPAMRTPFYQFPPLPPHGGLFPLPLQMQPFPASQMMPKYMPFSPFLFHSKYPLGKKTFRCSECRYVTDRKNNLKRHVATMHQDCGKTLECCDIVFKSKAALRDHVLLFHRTGYKCRYCGRNFCRKALLKRHLAVHNGQKDFICSICDYATSHKSNLERHKKVHGRSSPFSGDESWDGDYLPEPEECEDSEINVVGDTDMEDEEEERSVREMITQTSPGKDCSSGSDLKEAHDPMLGSAPIEAHKRLACRKGKFCLPDRLRQTHEKEAAELGEKDKEFGQGTEPDTPAYIKDLPVYNGQYERSQHLQDLSTKVKLGGHKRLCANPYKCSECTMAFPAQHQLAMHALMCKGTDKPIPMTLMGSSPDTSPSSSQAPASIPTDLRVHKDRQPVEVSSSRAMPSTSTSALPIVFSRWNNGQRSKLTTNAIAGQVSELTSTDSAKTVMSIALMSRAKSSNNSLDCSPETHHQERTPHTSRSSSPLSDDCNLRSLPLKKRCVTTVD